MKRAPISAWIALAALLVALAVTLVAQEWLWAPNGVIAAQSLGPWLKVPMRVFTFLGDEQFYLVTIPLVYWCIHKALGADLGVLLVLSSFTNGLLKSSIKNNRPFWVDPPRQLGSATSFSTPSGHAQTSAAFRRGRGVPEWATAARTLDDCAGRDLATGAACARAHPQNPSIWACDAVGHPAVAVDLRSHGAGWA